MFTGLVEELGVVRKVTKRRGSSIFSIFAPLVGAGLGVKESVAVNGVCLTVIGRSRSRFEVQAVEETLRKTTLGNIGVESRVNLERPLLPSTRLGGHFVLGHVDGMGTVESIETRRSSWLFWISVPQRFRRYLVPVGSIAVDGVSLTMATVRGSRFAVSIIPHTMEHTIFRYYHEGGRVNLEFDILGKYVERLLTAKRRKR
jgi:riboflavin synthase